MTRTTTRRHPQRPARRRYGVMTARWGWQPLAWLHEGLPTFAWRAAPVGLLTRRQMRAAGLAPGRAEPVAQIVCRAGRRRAYLYDRTELVAKRTATPAQLVAVGKALAARRHCPTCARDVGYYIPTSLGQCLACHHLNNPAYTDPIYPDPTCTGPAWSGPDSWSDAA